MVGREGSEDVAEFIHTLSSVFVREGPPGSSASFLAPRVHLELPGAKSAGIGGRLGEVRRPPQGVRSTPRTGPADPQGHASEPAGLEHGALRNHHVHALSCPTSGDRPLKRPMIGYLTCGVMLTANTVAQVTVPGRVRGSRDVPITHAEKPRTRSHTPHPHRSPMADHVPQMWCVRPAAIASCDLLLLGKDTCLTSAASQGPGHVVMTTRPAATMARQRQPALPGASQP